MSKNSLKIDTKKISRGDEKEFRRFYNYWVSKVYSFALQICKSNSLAEEVVQEVFMAVWQYRKQFENINNLEAYLFRMIKNTAFTIFKKHHLEIKHTSLFGDLAPIYSLPADHGILQQEVDQLMEQALRTLTAKQLQAYLLCKVDGLDYESAAKKMGVSKLTIKTHMQAALKKIRSFLKDHNASFMIPFLFLFIGQ